jgi:hypothetical protein
MSEQKTPYIPKEMIQAAMQRHHDRVMRRAESGELTDDERWDYYAAQRREEEGLVQPYQPQPKDNQSQSQNPSANFISSRNDNFLGVRLPSNTKSSNML